MDKKPKVKIIEINERCSICGREITSTEDIGAFEPDTVLDGATDEPGYYVCKDERCLEAEKRLTESEKQSPPLSKADQRIYTCGRCGHRFWWPIKKRIRYCAKCGHYVFVGRSAKDEDKLVETTELEPDTICVMCNKKITKVEDVGQIDADGLVYGNRKQYGWYICKDKKCLDKIKKFNERFKSRAAIYTKEDIETAQHILDMLDYYAKKND
jgi:DNA-directed RNA polymerase subunit RPC12/RpoP